MRKFVLVLLATFVVMTTVASTAEAGVFRRGGGFVGRPFVLLSWRFANGGLFR